MDTPSIVLWAASELLPTSCSLGRIKVRDVQMGAWGRAGRGRGGMNRAHRMSSSCKGTWHAGQRGALFHPGEERSGRLGVVTLDKIKGLTAKSERPETQSKLTKGTVAFSAKPQPGIVLLCLILISSFRETFSSEFFYEQWLLDVVFTLKLSCISVSLGWPCNWFQVLPVVSDTHWPEKQPFQSNTRLGKG